MTTRSLVSVVDDDESVRESLLTCCASLTWPPPRLVRRGFLARCDRQNELSDSRREDAGMSGPDLQRNWALGHEIPIVFITASW
jgi:FixJ family two-component response regulator